MQVFKDLRGNEWTIDITYSTLRKVRRDVKVDLLELVQSPEQAELLSTDDEKAVGVICCLLDGQITDVEEFYEGLDGDTIQAAWEAIVEGLINFFPKQKRPILRKVIEHAKSVEAKATREFEREVESLLNAELKTSESTSSSSQESSESTPALSPSEN